MLLIAAGFAAAAIVVVTPPVPQAIEYHQMADRRTLWGIPNALNVLSNLPFALVGVVGLATVFDRRVTFLHPWERWPYVALFAGVALTAVGSSYYHLAPDNSRLVWDRLPMTIGFMGLLASVIAERGSLRVARRVFMPLLVAGASSVAYWHWTELNGAGDLRPYAMVQFGSLMAVILMLVLYPSLYSGSAYLTAGLIAYAGAKVFELADGPIFEWSAIVSGHTLKHLVAAGGVAILVWMLRTRVQVATYPLRTRVFEDTALTMAPRPAIERGSGQVLNDRANGRPPTVG